MRPVDRAWNRGPIGPKPLAASSTRASPLRFLGPSTWRRLADPDAGLRGDAGCPRSSQRSGYQGSAAHVPPPRRCDPELEPSGSSA